MNAAVLSLSKHGKALSDISKNSKNARNQAHLLDPKRSFLSRLLFLWIGPLLRKGAERTLVYDDLPPLKQKYRSINLVRNWKLGTEVYIVRSLFLHYKWSILSAIGTKLSSLIFDYLNPLLLKLLIDSVTSNSPVSRGLTIAVLMFITSEIKSLLIGIHNYIVNRDAALALSIITNSISKKSMALSNESRNRWPSSRIVNLVAVDAEALVAANPYVHIAWSSILETILSMSLIYLMIGNPTVAAIIVMILYVPINWIAAKFIRRIQASTMRIKDQRLKLTTEVLHGIKVVKISAWEEPLQNEMDRLRREEVRLVLRANIISRILQAFNSAAPFLCAMASFAMFVLTNPVNSLTPQVAFVSLTIFNMLRRPMTLVAPAIHYLAKARVASKRLDAFLTMPENKNDRKKDHEDENENYEVSIDIHDAFFSWEEEKEHLKSIHLEMKEGDFHAVVGSLGSGKSTLLNAILGELCLLDGNRHVHGSIAYVPQNPWIMNSTVRANILYGQDYDKLKYDKITRACDLKKDFYCLPRCDVTVVGDNGATLSGGQKARIALARALYQDSEIYLLDEPFSAVDPNAAKAMYDKILGPQGLLAKKTVILVTHAINFTRNADQIHVMQGGQIVDSGTYDELIHRNDFYASMKSKLEIEIEKETARNDQTKSKPRKRKAKTVMFEPEQPDESERVLEQVERGKVKSSVYMKYLSAFTYTWFGVFMILLIARYTVQALGSIFLSVWTNDNFESQISNTSVVVDSKMNLFIYILLGVGTVILSVFCFVSTSFGSFKASIALHTPMISSIMKAPLEFFDKTPIGNVLSRLTRDLDMIDVSLPITLRIAIDSTVNILSVLVIICTVLPAFIFFIIPFLFANFLLLKFFLPSTRQIRRLESAQRSSLLSMLSQNIEGVISIRAFGRIRSTSLNFFEEVDCFTRCRYLQPATQRWQSLRLDLIGNLMVFVCAILVSIFHQLHLITAGHVALCVSVALSLTDLMNLAMRMISQTETNIVSVERVVEYQEIQQEAGWTSDYPLIDAWPHSGEIELKSFSLSYDEGKTEAIKPLTVTIKGGEKMGIVGRSGSGKSSLISGLLRLVESKKGEVFIDGVNIRELGLHQLRTRITVIPQDPVLFSSSLRFNLDPFDQFADSDLWLALESCQLKDTVMRNPQGLQWEVEEGGKNMCGGERQLVCLCRALLKGGQILILDEATANVDGPTEQLIMQVVQNHFKHATTIIIAHRLDTINDCDRIMVLDEGELVEIDTPEILHEKEDSLYRDLFERQKEQ